MMFGWLTRDPLNGLVITVTFFISMILGRYLRERQVKAIECKIEYKSERIDTRIKSLMSFLLIITATLMKHWYFPIAISIICVIIALRLRVFRDYCKKLVFPIILAFFIFAVQGFTYGVNIIYLGTIPLYSEGVEYGFLIFSRILASASILILLVLTASESELLESMRWFRVPGTIIDISSLMSRYIKTFSIEGRKLKLAQDSRCGFSSELSYGNRMNNIASICGLLVTRAFSKSDEVYRAMLSRAWMPGFRHYMDSRPLDRRDIVLGLLLFSGIIGLIGLDGFI